MDFRQLQYFVQVVQSGSLTRAAELLGVAQPALSQQIAKLEAELSEQLLHRRPRGVEPTESGAILYEDALNILQMLDQAKDDIIRRGRSAFGKVRIGMPSSVAALLAVPLVQEISDKLPGITLRLVEGLSEVLNEMLATNRLDLVFSFNPMDVPGVIHEPLLQEALYLVECFPGGGATGPVAFSEAVARPLILPSHPHGLRILVGNACNATGAELKTIHEIDSVPIIRDLVESGLAASILPLRSVQRSVDASSLVARRIVDPEITRTLFLSTPRSAPGARTRIAVTQVLRGMIGTVLTQLGTDATMPRVT